MLIPVADQRPLWHKLMSFPKKLPMEKLSRLLSMTKQLTPIGGIYGIIQIKNIMANPQPVNLGMLLWS